MGFPDLPDEHGRRLGQYVFIGESHALSLDIAPTETTSAAAP